MTKVKEKETITNADCNVLGHAIQDLISSVPSMSVDTLMYFKKIQKKIDVIGEQTFKKQEEIIHANVKLGKNKKPMLTEVTEENPQQEYIYKSDDARQKAEADMQKLFTKVVVTSFEKIHPSVIGGLQINPSRNPRFSSIMEMLLEEGVEEMKAV